MFSPEKLFGSNTMVEGRDVLELFYVRMSEFSHRYRPEPEKQEMYRHIASLMLQESEEKQEGYKEAVNSLFWWFLLDLNREYGKQGPQEVCYVPGERIKHKKIISEVLNYVEEHYKEEINLGSLAEQLYVNQSYLSREFKKSTGYSMVKFITNKRIREARTLLCSTEMSVTEVAMTVGYNNITHFNAMFKKETGISPKEFRKQMQSQR